MDLQTALSQIIPAGRVLTQPIQRYAYANDASYFWLVPQAVVQPQSIGEVQALFRFSQQQRIPLTFRAAGTSLSGQALTDGILVDISKHWRRLQVEQDGALLRAQPGLVGAYLNAVLKPYGRRIGPDPASIDACMLGGILANNSSGMCCGVTENAYRTLQSMTFVLPNGLVIDSASPQAEAELQAGAPHIAAGLLELKARLRSDAALAQRVRQRYQVKNNNGYLLNAFLDYETPLDLLTHLLVGSEGTLGFIAEAVLRTLPDYPLKYTGQLYFPSVQDAAAAIAPLRQSGARAAEIMDRASLRSVEQMPGVPALLRQLPPAAAAILVEYQGAAAADMQAFSRAAEQACRGLRLLHDPHFTADPAEQAALWKPRKGIIASVGALRAAGTTSLIEDVVFPVPRLADAVTDLQKLFDDHGYPEGVIFGHAKDGNLHFLVNQSFNSEAEIRRFDRFMLDLVRVVSGKYDGALKAEHGTGRNMAPFVEMEWGAAAYQIMRDLKSLLDPDGLLSPGVLINPDPQAHVTHLKSIPVVSPLIDRCIECGFCEPKCPSRRLTLTPRQRIIVLRAIARLEQDETSSSEAAGLAQAFQYAGLDTCATDGLCASACPVNINTGDLVKHLRAESARPRAQRAAGWAAQHFGAVEKGLGTLVQAGHAAEGLLGWQRLADLSKVGEKALGTALPKWRPALPRGGGRLPRTRREEAAYVYFPACISRQLGGGPAGNGPVGGGPLGRRPAGSRRASLAQTLVQVAERGGVRLWIPEDIAGTCCGMPFGSKGYAEANQAILVQTLERLWRWTEAGRLPVVIDTSSCLYTLRTASGLPEAAQETLRKLSLLDSIEFLHDVLLPRLALTPLDEEVMLHPNCSARKLGLQDKLLAVARRCARQAVVPLDLDCCGFAGDRGLLFPELTASATALEAAEVNRRAYGGYYSSNLTCELGMSAATGQDYCSIVYLVERASRPPAPKAP